jgi:hypothetical protein
MKPAIEFTTSAHTVIDGEHFVYHGGESIDILEVRKGVDANGNPAPGQSTIEGVNGTIFTIPSSHFNVINNDVDMAEGQAICRARVNHPLDACSYDCVYFDPSRQTTRQS